MKTKQTATFGDLVQAIQDTAWSDTEVVAVITHLLKTRRVAFAKTTGPSVLTQPAGARQEPWSTTAGRDTRISGLKNVPPRV